MPDLLEQPGAADLLATARAVLLETLLPALPEERRFEARMVANAMAIAGRALAAEPAPLAARLADAAGGAPDPLRALAVATRAGKHDPGTPTHAAVAALLRDLARARCAVSAPKALG